MLEFLIFISFILYLITLGLLIATLRTVDENSDSLYDIEKNLRQLKKRGKK